MRGWVRSVRGGRGWAFWCAVLVLVGLAVPAVGAVDEIPVEEGISQFKGVAPGSTAEGRAQMQEALAVRERAEAELKERLASPEAEGERKESLTAHRGLGDGAAVALLEREFGSELKPSFPDAAALADGGRIERFHDDRTMVVEGEGEQRPRLIEAPYPLRAPDADAGGAKEPVELELESEGDAFVPEVSAVETTVPKELDAGVKVDRVRVFPAGDAAGSLVGKETVAYPNAATDTDVAVVPVATGAEVLVQVRSPEAGEEQRLRFEMPE